MEYLNEPFELVPLTAEQEEDILTNVYGLGNLERIDEEDDCLLLLSDDDATVPLDYDFDRQLRRVSTDTADDDILILLDHEEDTDVTATLSRALEQEGGAAVIADDVPDPERDDVSDAVAETFCLQVLEHVVNRRYSITNVKCEFHFLPEWLAQVQRGEDPDAGITVGFNTLSQSLGRLEVAETSRPSGSKVTVGFPEDPNLVSLKTYLDTKVMSRTDLIRCLSLVMSSLPTLQHCQKNHQELNIDNIYVEARGKILEHICFVVDIERERAVEEDAAAIMKIINTWTEAHPELTGESTV